MSPRGRPPRRRASAAEKAIELADRSQDDLSGRDTSCRYCTRTSAPEGGTILEWLWMRRWEIAGDANGIANGLVIGCPVAWAVMVKGVVRRERGRILDQASELFETALRIAGEHGDPETEGWTRGNQILVHGSTVPRDRMRPTLLAQRNYEAVERLGATFSRAILCPRQPGRRGRTQNEDYEGALERRRGEPLPRRDGQKKKGARDCALSCARRGPDRPGADRPSVAAAEQAVAASGDRGMARGGSASPADTRASARCRGESPAPKPRRCGDPGRTSDRVQGGA